MSISADKLHDEMMALCGNNVDAVNFINRFWRLCIVWDDAVDRDKSGGEQDVNDAFMWALFGINDDPFYIRYAPILRASIMQCVASWQVANRFERSGERHKVEQAYFLRCSPYDVFSTVVLLCSGFDKMIEAVEFLRSFAPEDTLKDYLAEHKE